MDGITKSMDMSLSKVQEMVKDREVWRVAVHGFEKIWTCLNALTALVDVQFLENYIVLDLSLSLLFYWVGKKVHLAFILWENPNELSGQPSS